MPALFNGHRTQRKASWNPRMGPVRATTRTLALSLCLANLTQLTAPNARAAAESFDAAPFGLPLPEGNGVRWEDPREIHRVVVQFAGPPPPDVRLEYWSGRWSKQRLPKDHEPGGGRVSWYELGNWHTHKWREADTEVAVVENQRTFTFRPGNAKESPKLADYPADFRFTLKIRVNADTPLPPIKKLGAFTDSVIEARTVQLAFAEATAKCPDLTAFNGAIEDVEEIAPAQFRVRLRVVVNSDPNTFDRTLVTVRNGK